MMPPSDFAFWGPPGALGSGCIAGWDFTLNVQRGLPVARAMARNFPSHEPANTVPCATVGVAVTARFAGTNHRCVSVCAEAGVSEVGPLKVLPCVRPNIGHRRQRRWDFTETVLA